jgi:hypothetical protein
MSRLTSLTYTERRRLYRLAVFLSAKIQLLLQFASNFLETAYEHALSRPDSDALRDPRRR